MIPAYVNKGEYLLVEVRGLYRFEDFRSMIHEVAKFCSENDLHKVVVDLREAEGDPSTIDRYLLGNEIAAVWQYRIRGAGVAGKQSINFLMENVAVNRGANVKAFSDVQAALKWLGITAMGEYTGA
jgi:hypothetical protein